MFIGSNVVICRSEKKFFVSDNRCSRIMNLFRERLRELNGLFYDERFDGLAVLRCSELPHSWAEVDRYVYERHRLLVWEITFKKVLQICGLRGNVMGKTRNRFCYL